jgi:hypothetical protein
MDTMENFLLMNLDQIAHLHQFQWPFDLSLGAADAHIKLDIDLWHLTLKVWNSYIQTR